MVAHHFGEVADDGEDIELYDYIFRFDEVEHIHHSFEGDQSQLRMFQYWHAVAENHGSVHPVEYIFVAQRTFVSGYVDLILYWVGLGDYGVKAGLVGVQIDADSVEEGRTLEKLLLFWLAATLLVIYYNYHFETGLFIVVHDVVANWLEHL